MHQEFDPSLGGWNDGRPPPKPGSARGQRRGGGGERPQQQQQRHHGGGGDPSQLAQAWSVSLGEQDGGRPDTADSAFAANRARAQGSGTPWAEHGADVRSDSLVAGDMNAQLQAAWGASTSAAPGAGYDPDPYKRPDTARSNVSTPWAEHDEQAEEIAPPVHHHYAGGERSHRVKTPWATQQSFEGRLVAQATLGGRARPSSAAAPWEREERKRGGRLMTPPPSPSRPSQASSRAHRPLYDVRTPIPRPRPTGLRDCLDCDSACVTPTLVKRLSGKPARQDAPPYPGHEESGPPRSPPGIQQRQRGSAPYAEDSALDAAWAASTRTAQPAASPSPQPQPQTASYGGHHPVPPWEQAGTPADKQPRGKGAALPAGVQRGSALASAYDPQLAGAWAAQDGGGGGGGGGRVRGGGVGADGGGSAYDPQLAAAWAAQDGRGEGGEGAGGSRARRVVINDEPRAAPSHSYDDDDDGGGESSTRVYWVAVPKALRARRVNRRRRSPRWSQTAAASFTAAGARRQRRSAQPGTSLTARSRPPRSGVGGRLGGVHVPRPRPRQLLLRARVRRGAGLRRGDLGTALGGTARPGSARPRAGGGMGCVNGAGARPGQLLLRGRGPRAASEPCPAEAPAQESRRASAAGPLHEEVSPFLACIGSPCLRHCVHGVSIGPSREASCAGQLWTMAPTRTRRRRPRHTAAAR
jgi:hypothetical protein